MTPAKPKGIKLKEPLWTPTHIYMGGEKLVFFNIGEELSRVGDSEFEGAAVYENEGGHKQHVHDTDVKEI